MAGKGQSMEQVIIF